MPNTPKKILILGHKGMLGNAVHKYFSKSPQSYEIITLNSRFGDDLFIEEIKNKAPDYIINCIGIIPQKNRDPKLYEKINIELPIILEGLNIKTIHPSTDCEFSGNIDNTKKYSKSDIRDATDDYGKSKAVISEKIENSFKNTKIVRTSIIGHEENSHLSLLDWFLNSSNEVNGYTNHYWNGITTLEWAKLCEQLIDNWDEYHTLNQYGTKEIRSKYDLLNDIKFVYNKDINIKEFAAPQSVNKCLESDKEIPTIIEQLKELKEFYNK
ncbi:MAG: sugar nucleotide-binding protein [Candidatus Paceibacterota bacterium]|jgi:dTDP-4-dehydrorhamnose reductase